MEFFARTARIPHGSRAHFPSRNISTQSTEVASCLESQRSEYLGFQQGEQHGDRSGDCIR